jgi:hypothetical protein
VDDEGVTGGGIGTVIDVTAGSGGTPGSAVTSAAAGGAGAIAERSPNHDRPTATAVTTAHAARYPIDRLTAETLP